jgi:hypothetical protein
MAIDLGLNRDHVGGTFEWDCEPSCCDMFKDAVDGEKFVFVSNFVSGPEDHKSNNLYIMTLAHDGEFARSDGISISFCPWCVAKADGFKKYPE